MQLTFDDLFKKPIEINREIRLIELFGGVGSQAMALRNIGAKFQHYRLVEYDKYPVMSYNAIHGTNFEPLDITKIKGSDLQIIDTDKFTYIMTYSFPCQDLSISGNQKGMAKGSGTRSGLLWEVERLLKEVKNLPQVLVMENVPMVHNKENMPDFRKWIDVLTDLGYSNYYQDLNAKKYGAAQNRERCFMVSILGDYNYKFPNQIGTKRNMQDILENSVDEKYYVKAQKAKDLIEELYTNNEIKVNRKRYEGLRMLGQMDNSDGTHEVHNRVYDPMGVGPTCTTGSGAQGKFLEVKESKGEDTYIIDNKTYSIRIRTTTPLETWRMMGFTDEDFEKAQKVNSNTQLYKQAGNSIVVNCLEAIFSQMNIQGIPAWNDSHKE